MNWSRLILKRWRSVTGVRGSEVELIEEEEE